MHHLRGDLIINISLNFNSKQVWLGFNTFIKMLNLVIIPFILYVQLIFSVSGGLNIDEFTQVYLNVFVLGAVLCLGMIAISFYNYAQVYPSFRTLLLSTASEALYLIYLLFWAQLGNISIYSLNSVLKLNVSILFLPFLGIPVILMMSNYIQYRDERKDWIFNYLLLNIIQNTHLKSVSQLRHEIQQYKNLKEARDLIRALLKDLDKTVKTLKKLHLIHSREPFELTGLGLKIVEKMKKSSYFYNHDYLIYSKDMAQWDEPVKIARGS